MTIFSRYRLSGAALFAALLAITGCDSNQGSLSGDVTYEGEPVKSGYISFIPEGGKGPVAAAPINNGKYSLDNIPPGPKVVKIEAGTGAAPSVQSQEDVGKMSKEMKGKVGPTGIINTETVPDDAEGNNQKIEVTTGAKSLNFVLKKPKGKS